MLHAITIKYKCFHIRLMLRFKNIHLFNETLALTRSSYLGGRGPFSNFNHTRFGKTSMSHKLWSRARTGPPGPKLASIISPRLKTLTLNRNLNPKTLNRESYDPGGPLLGIGPIWLDRPFTVGDKIFRVRLFRLGGCNDTLEIEKPEYL